MIAREVELEQMRRNENTASSMKHNSRSKVSIATVGKSNEATIEEKAANATYALPKLSGTFRSRLCSLCALNVMLLW